MTTAPNSKPQTIGILGGGQLARMLTLAGHPLGLRFRILDPEPNCPASPVAEHIIGAYDDDKTLARFADGITVATYEFENVPAHTAQWLTDHVPVFPPAHALATSQDRIAEKTLFRQLGIPTPNFAQIDTLDQLRAAAQSLGLPAVLKTRRLGYDGKGQFVLRDPADIDRAWTALGTPTLRVGRSADRADLILESFVPFTRELSIIAVRGYPAGPRREPQVAFYPAAENHHSRGILSRSQSPAPNLDPVTQQSLESAAAKLLTHLNYTGVLAIEFFQLKDGELLANEMAPRVHNSGHWSLEGSTCSQFENHIRAVAGLPLGSTAPNGTSVMHNIIGARPSATDILTIPGAHLHDYGKSPRPGRKLGHITLCSTDPRTLAESTARLETLLAASGSRP